MSTLVDSYPQVSATEAGAHLGRVLDQAQRGPVTIVRRGAAKFVLLRGEEYERQLARQAADSYPRLTLDQLLAGYDRTKHRSGWPDDGPVGRETL